MAETTKRRSTGRAMPRAARDGEENSARLRSVSAPKDEEAVGRRRPRGRGADAPSLLDTLRERIARQQIPPASKLREHEVALEFGVPRTQVREAFSALEQRGLIERIPNRGAIVTRLDIAQVFHIYHVREVLEGLCA